MILEFGAKNFYSFKEGFEVNLRSNDRQTAYNVFAVKGANASGKTNVFKLLQFLHYFTLHSFTKIEPGEEILIDSYFDNTEPIEMYIIFLMDGVEYKYELTLTKEEVIYECFHRKLKSNRKIIERKNEKIVSAIDEFSELKKIKLRKNASMLSTALQHEIEAVTILQKLFNSIMTNVDAFGREDQHSNDHEFESKIYNSSDAYLKFLIEILKKADTGIEDIKILEREDKETNKKIYFPIFDYMIDGEIKSLTYYDQSSGTKALYLQLWRYKIALNLGDTLALDEFDINLHPDILPMIVDLFDDPEKNINNAQLIFTTHNTDIMDKLGKYRIALVNKEDNESFLYRLDEIPGDILRNDRPITPVYKAGKIGGKPKLTA